MSLITFNSGLTVPETAIGHIEPQVVVHRNTSVTISEPGQVVPGGASVRVLINTEIKVDVAHVMVPSNPKKEAVVVSRMTSAITKTLNSVDLLEVPVVANDKKVLQEAHDHLKRLNGYYKQLGDLSAPIPADNALIGETGVDPLATATHLAKLQSNIASRTNKLVEFLSANQITGTSTSDVMDDLYTVLDSFAERGIEIDETELRDAIMQPPCDNIIATGPAGPAA